MVKVWFQNARAHGHKHLQDVLNEHAQKDSQCPFCTEIFSDKDLVASHILLKHSGVDTGKERKRTNKYNGTNKLPTQQDHLKSNYQNSWDNTMINSGMFSSAQNVQTNIHLYEESLKKFIQDISTMNMIGAQMNSATAHKRSEVGTLLSATAIQDDAPLDLSKKAHKIFADSRHDRKDFLKYSSGPSNMTSLQKSFNFDDSHSETYSEYDGDSSFNAMFDKNESGMFRLQNNYNLGSKRYRTQMSDLSDSSHESDIH